ncbi:MAG: competence/damage-inducible protein A [Chloroflexota bacterium]
MFTPPAAEIIVFGNVVVDGVVLDSNSHWLCARLTGLGARVERVQQVRDDPAAIGEALRGALARAARLIITSGGLGPTADDLTLEAIGAALDRPVAVDAAAHDWVRGRYAELAALGWVATAEVLPARAKMACLPRGAAWLPNQVGTAPGVMMRQGPSLIVCLPGVPAELKHIFVGPLRPTLTELLGAGSFVEWKATVVCGDESLLAPILQRVAAEHAEVYIKSRAKPFDGDLRFLITLSARGASPHSVEAAVQGAWDALQRGLKEAAIAIVGLDATQPAGD